jgi:hypothetical protein
MSTTTSEVFTFHPEYKVAVHQSHCCERHGCKYADTDCPVKLGTHPQAYPCEYCSEPAALRAEITELTEEYRWSLKIYRLSASRTYDDE